MDANKIKKGLGRGLSSLIGETKIESQKNKLGISEIVPNKFQPRKNFDEENLNDLVNSIRERGIIQPIIVRKSEDQISKYEIIAGERRWLAAQKAGLHEIYFFFGVNFETLFMGLQKHQVDDFEYNIVHY